MRLPKEFLSIVYRVLWPVGRIPMNARGDVKMERDPVRTSNLTLAKPLYNSL